MATRTVKTGSAIIAMPQVTRKPTAGKERQPELPWYTEMVNLREDKTKQLEKWNLKKRTGSNDTSDNLLGKVAILSRIRII
jgi:hypothetical protein